MEDQDYRVMTEANNAHLAAYLLHVLVRAQQRDITPDHRERRLLDQLRSELVASWLGAREVAVEGFAPAASAAFEVPNDASFGRQLDEYGRFREFHGFEGPGQHAVWVNDIVGQIDDLETRAWSELDPDEQSRIHQGLEALLRWMRSADRAGLPQRSLPAALA